jgi:hypothetical protein
VDDLMAFWPNADLPAVAARVSAVESRSPAVVDSEEGVDTTRQAAPRAMVRFNGAAKMRELLGEDETDIDIFDSVVHLDGKYNVRTDYSRDEAERIQYALLDASERADEGTKCAVIIPTGRIQIASMHGSMAGAIGDDAALYIPTDVKFMGLAGQSEQQLAVVGDLGDDNYAVRFADAGRKTCVGENFTVTAQNISNLPWSTTPPAAMRGVCAPRGAKLKGISTIGAFKYGCTLDTDHVSFEGCQFSGWAAVAYVAPRRSGGDILFIDCTLIGKVASVSCEPDTHIGGTTFIRCHGGFSPYVFYKPSTGTDTLFLSGSLLEYFSFEAFGYGAIVNPDQLSDLFGVVFNSCGAAGVYEGTAPASFAGTKDAMIKVREMRDVDIIGTTQWLDYPGTDAGGALIKGTIANCDLGDRRPALANCAAAGRAFNIGSTPRGVRMLGGEVNAEPNRTVLRRVGTSAAIRANEVVRPTLRGRVAKYNTVAKAVAGVAVLPGIQDANIPVVIEGQARVKTNGFPFTIAVGAQTFPLADGGATTLAADITLGTTARLRITTTLPGSGGASTIEVLGDIAAYASSGEISLDGSVVAYTGKSAIDANTFSFTGCTGGTGFPLGNTPVGRVAQVASVTGFPTGGGVADIGGQVVTYASVSGTRLVGVSNGTGTISSGAAVQNKAGLRVQDAALFSTFTAAVAGTRQFTYTGIITDLVKAYRRDYSDERRAYLLAPIGGSGSVADAANVIGGAPLGAIANLPVTQLNVGSLNGFPYAGQVNVGGQTVTYTSRAGVFLNGCTGGTGSMPIGTPVTPIPGATVAADLFVRPAYGTTVAAAFLTDLQGVAGPAASHVDAEAPVCAVSALADIGGTVDVSVQSRYG